MGLLNWYFSDERKAKKALYSDARIGIIWSEYLYSFKEKKEAIKSLSPQNLKPLKSFPQTFKKDMIRLGEDSRLEEEVIDELNSISHSQRMKRIRVIKQGLDHALTRYEYVHELMIELANTLESELILVKRLMKHGNEAATLVPHLNNQISVEEQIIKKIGTIESFHSLFVSVAKNDHFFRELDKRKGSLRKRMWNRMGQIFSGEITEGVTAVWTEEVLRRVEEITLELYNEGKLDDTREGYQFVNSPYFDRVVKESLLKVRFGPVSDKLILVFTNHFREWYNHCREDAI